MKRIVLAVIVVALTATAFVGGRALTRSGASSPDPIGVIQLEAGPTTTADPGPEVPVDPPVTEVPPPTAPPPPPPSPAPRPPTPPAPSDDDDDHDEHDDDDWDDWDDWDDDDRDDD